MVHTAFSWSGDRKVINAFDRICDVSRSFVKIIILFVNEYTLGRYYVIAYYIVYRTHRAVKLS